MSTTLSVRSGKRRASYRLQLNCVFIDQPSQRSLISETVPHVYHTTMSINYERRYCSLFAPSQYVFCIILTPNALATLEKVAIDCTINMLFQKAVCMRYSQLRCLVLSINICRAFYSLSASPCARDAFPLGRISELISNMALICFAAS